MALGMEQLSVKTLGLVVENCLLAMMGPMILVSPVLAIGFHPAPPVSAETASHPKQRGTKNFYETRSPILQAAVVIVTIGKQSRSLDPNPPILQMDIVPCPLGIFINSNFRLAVLGKPFPLICRFAFHL